MSEIEKVLEAQARKEAIEGAVQLILEETQIAELRGATDEQLLGEAGVKPDDLPLIRMRIRVVEELLEHVRRFPVVVP